MESTTSPDRPNKPVIGKIGIVVEWGIFTLFALLVLTSLNHLQKINVPNAPVYGLYTSLVVGLLVTILLLPPVFIRLHLFAKVAAYLGIAVWLTIFGIYSTHMQVAYERTPAGAKEAAIRHKAEDAETAQQAVDDQSKLEEAKSAANAARIEGTRDEAVAQMKELEKCFSTFGHRLPTLENPVKDSLENPEAFQHVKTELTGPDTEGNNVTMTFRAQNGFGAIRTVQVSAHLIADDCSVQKIGRPQDN